MKTKDALTLWGHIVASLLFLSNFLTLNARFGENLNVSGVVLYYVLAAITAASLTITIAKIRSLK
jgi:hypothetical protein